MDVIGAEDPIAIALVEAIHSGSVDDLDDVLRAHPGLSQAGVADECGVTRTPLHIVADWPGHFPNGAETVRRLIAAGADANARVVGVDHAETPLHWAASSDDVEVLDALIDGGADLEADGAVIAGGTPLSDAVAFGQWETARRLVERGANTPLREAAALGLIDRVVDSCADGSTTPDDINQAFWYAAHGDQLTSARFLLDLGADLHWVSPWDGLTPLDAARRTNENGEAASWLAGETAAEHAQSSSAPSSSPDPSSSAS